MSANKYRSMTDRELDEELMNLRKAQFVLRMQRGIDQLSQHHEFRQTRREIARLKTVRNERRRAEVGKHGGR